MKCRSVHRNGASRVCPLGGIAFPGMHDVIMGKQHVLHEGGDAVGVSGDAAPAGY